MTPTFIERAIHMLPDCNLSTASRDDIRRYSLLAALVSASPIVTADDARQLTMSLSTGFSDASMQLENDLAELNRYQLINGDLSILNTTSPTRLEPISVSEKGKGLVRILSVASYSNSRMDSSLR